MENKSYRYRLTFQFSEKGIINPSEEFGRETHRIGGPGYGNTEPISLASFGSPMIEADTFQFSQGGFPTPEAAWKEARESQMALAYLAATLNVGVHSGKLDIGEYTAQKAEPGYVKFSEGFWGDKLDKERTQIIGQKIGITVVEQPAPDYDFVSVHLHADLQVSPLTAGGFLMAWSKAGEKAKFSLSKKGSLALELYNNSFFEKSSRTQMLTLMQMIECLAPSIDRPGLVKRTLNEFIEETEAKKLRAEKTVKELTAVGVTTSESIEEKSVRQRSVEENEALVQSYKGILSSLQNLKKESISSSIAAYAEKLCSGQKFGQAAPSEFVRKCYSLRSTLTHSGTVSISDSELSTVIKQLRQLCLAALRAEIGFDKVELEVDWAASAQFLGGIQFEGEPLMSMHELLNPTETDAGAENRES